MIITINHLHLEHLTLYLALVAKVDRKRVVLAIGAHPDDVEFGCGATMAKLASEGAEIYFVVCTDGNRGSRQHQIARESLVNNRHQETIKASQILGAKEVIFLNEEDGNLVADIHFKEKIVRLIRKYQPEMIFTHDPKWFYLIRDNGQAAVNHTDHRACGEAVLDAVYPLARDLQSFPQHIQEGLSTHHVPELYLFNFEQPNFVFDVSTTIEAKIKSIKTHHSQIDDPQKITENIKSRLAKIGQEFGYKYGEGFIKLTFIH